MSSNSITNVLFAPGRIVGGDHYEVKQKTDQQKQPRFYPAAHKYAGQPMMECYFPIAIPKAPNQLPAALAAIGLAGFAQGWAIKPVFADGRTWDQVNPGTPYWGEVIWMEGHKEFPRLVDPTTQRIMLPTFAWKIEDGDDTMPKGENQTRNCDRAGYAGHWIVNLKSGNVPKFYDSGKPLPDKGTIKRGWWVEVFGSVQGNGQTQKPGMYLNHSMVSFVAPGEEITYGPSLAQAGFGRIALPPGLSRTPLAVGGNFPSAGGLPSGLPGQGILPAQGAGLPTAQGVSTAGVPAGLPGGLGNPALNQPGLSGALGLGAGSALGLPGASVPAGFNGLPGGSALPAQTSPSNGPFVPGVVPGTALGGATVAGSPLPGAPAALPQFGAQPAGLGIPMSGQPGAAAQVGVQPAQGFLAPPGLPTAAQAAPVPVLKPELVAQGYTWPAMVVQGVTEAQARQNGWLM